MIQPTPCAHCGLNYMKKLSDVNFLKLCNSCDIRENLRTKRDVKMNLITILIECERQTQIEIEELCINKGINFSEYFLELHENSKKCPIQSNEKSEQKLTTKAYKK